MRNETKLEKPWKLCFCLIFLRYCWTFFIEKRLSSSTSFINYSNVLSDFNVSEDFKSEDYRQLVGELIYKICFTWYSNFANLFVFTEPGTMQMNNEASIVNSLTKSLLLIYFNVIQVKVVKKCFVGITRWDEYRYRTRYQSFKWDEHYPAK